MSNKEYSESNETNLKNRFLNLAINRFTWENLPEGMTSRLMEENLIRGGQVMFFVDNGIQLILPCMGGARRDIYNQPTEYIVNGNGYMKTIQREDGVVIRNNATSTDDYTDLSIFAKRINEVEQTMDVNLNAQKTPFIVLCDEKERLTFKNIMNQVNKFKYAIFGSKRLGMNNIDVLQTKSEFLLDKLQAHKNSLLNELLTFLGINNNNIDKKERLVVDEVNANNDFILVNLDHMYDERKLACDLINEKYGLNIKVSKREVDTNGELYPGTKEDNQGGN